MTEPAEIADRSLPVSQDRRQRRVILWTAVVVAAWVVRYVTMEGVDILHPGWTSWYDQGRYLDSALALRAGNLAPAHHWYPLGYSLLAAPFTLLLPSNPFLPLDLLLFAATFAGFHRVAARLGIGTGLAAAVFVLTTLVQAGLAGGWVRPWTTTLSAALIWWLVEWTMAAGDPGPVSNRRWFGFGMAAGALPLVRPLDALIAATCLLVVSLRLAQRRRLTPTAVAAIAAGGVGLVAAYAALHLAIYGPAASEYMQGSAHVGFVLRDLGFKAYVLLVRADAWFPGSTTILQSLPWIVPGAAGLIATSVTGPGRRASMLLLALILPSSTIMLTFADLMPPGLWRFGNIHYFKWAMPAFGLGCVLAWRGLRDPRRRPGAITVMVALAVPVLFVRIVPVPIDPNVPARMLFFHGRVDRNWDEAFLSPVTLHDASGALRSPGEFHQVPGPGGERALAIVRPFVAEARRNDPLEPNADPRPYARFGERITFGW